MYYFISSIDYRIEKETGVLYVQFVYWNKNKLFTIALILLSSIYKYLILIKQIRVCLCHVLMYQYGNGANTTRYTIYRRACKSKLLNVKFGTIVVSR